MNSNDVSRTRIRLSPKATKIFTSNKIGVALGPGLPSGLVDLGMLVAMEQLKIPIKMISGTSMGAVIGAMFASGLSAKEIRKGAIELFSKDGVKKLLLEDMKFPRFGLSKAEKLIEELKIFVGWDPEFYELMIPLFIIAADKVSQKSVILRHGNVFDAVRASMAMPVIMTKKKIGDMELADGAIFSPLNTEVLYSEGADFVMGIQAKLIQSEEIRELPLKTKLSPQMFKVLGWDTSSDVLFSKPECEILLRPRVPLTLISDLNYASELIDLGVKITYDAINEIDKKSSIKRSKIKEKPFQQEEENVKIREKIVNVESLLKEIEKNTAQMTDGKLIDEFPKFAKVINDFLIDISNNFPDLSHASEALKNKLNNFVELVNQSPFMNRCLNKPRGYAGDYQMMNYLYDDQVFEASSNIGKLLNFFLFSSSPANAVRNRAKIVQGFILERLVQLTKISITSIASGPAREVNETIKKIPKDKKKYRINWTLLDQDSKSLEYARSHTKVEKMLKLKFINQGIGDILKNKLIFKEQDIIYSMGLFDYLEDNIASKLISYLYNFLKPGGVLLIGNFHPNNPLRALMEAYLEWFLIHRSEEELLTVAQNGAPEGSHYIMAEPEGVNLILVTSKPINP